MKRTATYVGHDRVLLRTANGYKMWVDARDVSITPHLILDGVYEEHTDAVLRSLVKPGMRVLEIGANVGLFTLLMAHRTGTTGSVLSFECDPTLAQILRDNVEVNGFSRIVTVDERAVSERPGTLRFYTAEKHRGGGTLVEGLQQIPELRTTERREIDVEATTIDEVMKQHPSSFDFIKVDAEGAETAIFRGGSSLIADRSRTLTIMVEFAPAFMQRAGDDPSRHLTMLQADGFRLHRIDERRKRIEPTSADALLGQAFNDVVLIRP